jgi:ATP-dependent 26S proteasome regulatory subunit
MSGLNIEMKRLIEALSRNDMSDAKTRAIQILSDDTVKADENFVRSYLDNLTDKHNQLPAGIQCKLIGSLPEDFNVGRYYLSDREKETLDVIVRMNAVAEKMAAMKILYPNTILLYGPSGSGKTVFARYAAWKLNLPCYYINFSSLIDSYMGGTSRNLESVFAYLSTVKAVLILDEIDCIAMRRSGHGSTGPDAEIERTTISLMQALDKLQNTSVIIAATNRRDILDEAVLRRFTYQHEVVPFSDNENLAMVRKFLEDTAAKDFLSAADILEIIRSEKVQGRIMPAVIRKIGMKMFNSEPCSAGDYQ